MPKRKPIILILLNLVVILPLLLIYLTPFLAETGIGWFVSMLGMGFPYLIGIMILLLLIWLFRLGKPLSTWMIGVNIVVLILGFQQIRAAFGFHFFSSQDVMERTDGIRVMSWNVSRWDINNWDNKNHQTYQPLMYDLIEQTNPDVLLFQEFFNCSNPKIVVSYVDLLAARGYPHYYFTPHSITASGAFQSGLAIFSKYPISDTAFFFPESAGHSEGYQYADITIRDKKIRFFNTHLESPGMNSDEVASVGKVRGSRTLFNKLKYSHHVRMEQARGLKDEMNKSPYPVILGGDIGELPNSTTYFFVRKNLQDAFTKKGSGIGRTFGYIAPTLRIDYLFVSPKLNVESFFVINKDYSAHYPIISDISE